MSAFGGKADMMRPFANQSRLSDALSGHLQKPSSPVLLDLRRCRGGGPSPTMSKMASSVLAPSKCTCLPKWVTKVPAGIGTVASPPRPLQHGDEPIVRV